MGKEKATEDQGLNEHFGHEEMVEDPDEAKAKAVSNEPVVMGRLDLLEAENANLRLMNLSLKKQLLEVELDMTSRNIQASQHAMVQQQRQIYDKYGLSMNEYVVEAETGRFIRRETKG